MGFVTFAFDPIPDHIEMLARSVVLNGVDHLLHAYTNGLSDFRAVRKIHYNAKNKGSSGITEPQKGIHNLAEYDNEKILHLDLIKLDDILPTMQRYPDLDIAFFKSDVEGFESRMFSGGRKTLAYYMPKDIQMEMQAWTFKLTNCSCFDHFHAFLKLGYTNEPHNMYGLTVSNDDVVRDLCRRMVGATQIDVKMHKKG